MALPDIFSKTETEKIIERINRLQPQTTANWGKMNVAQMLAHCNVSYEMVFDKHHAKPNAFMKFVLKMLVKSKVVSEIPYKKNGQTAPQFVISDSRDFSKEQKRLIDYLIKTQELGGNYFDGKESHSFGVLNKTEWSNMFYKHLDHHLNQFGV